MTNKEIKHNFEITLKKGIFGFSKCPNCGTNICVICGTSFHKCKKCKENIYITWKEPESDYRTIGDKIKSGIISGILISVFIIILGIFLSEEYKSPESKKIEQTKTLTEEEKMANQANKCAKHLTKLIKISMNDPKSYEHIDTVYFYYDNHILISTKFRGKNAFGAIVFNEIKAQYTLDGEFVQFYENIYDLYKKNDKEEWVSKE